MLHMKSVCQLHATRPMWDLWYTKGHWSRFLFEHFRSALAVTCFTLIYHQGLLQRGLFKAHYSGTLCHPNATTYWRYFRTEFMHRYIVPTFLKGIWRKESAVVAFRAGHDRALKLTHKELVTSCILLCHVRCIVIAVSYCVLVCDL
jgi:hypothetical protein